MNEYDNEEINHAFGSPHGFSEIIALPERVSMALDELVPGVFSCVWIIVQACFDQNVFDCLARDYDSEFREFRSYLGVTCEADFHARVRCFC